jgi:hypothetical protein
MAANRAIPEVMMKLFLFMCNKEYRKLNEKNGACQLSPDWFPFQKAEDKQQKACNEQYDPAGIQKRATRPVRDPEKHSRGENHDAQ